MESPGRVSRRFWRYGGTSTAAQIRAKITSTSTVVTLRRRPSLPRGPYLAPVEHGWMLGGPERPGWVCNDPMPTMSGGWRSLRLYYEHGGGATKSANFCKHWGVTDVAARAVAGRPDPGVRGPGRGRRRGVRAG